MDRASFLRSLNFLRPVKSEVWDNAAADNNNDISIDMSGSTITPPTPSKSNAMVLFQEESMFVVSIEPTLSSDISVVDNGEDGMRKKRGRDDDMLHTKQKDGSTNTVWPAFFHQDSTIEELSKSAKTTDTVNGDDNMDVDYNTVTEQSSLKHQTNSDPSLCTFEAVILKKLPSELGDETTPNDKNQQQQQQQQQQDTSELSNDTDSKTLLFRVGGHFVFQVDDSAILDVTYQPGDDDEEDNDTANNKDSSKEGEDKEKGSPPSKRQRNETGNGTAKDKTSSTKSTKVPPCLIISFSSCVLRVFSLKEDTKDDGNASGSNDTPNDKTSRIWGTLATAETTVENRLKNAHTVLLQQFDIEERKHNSQLLTSWKMAPPGSGLSFHSWPKVFEDSSFHINALQYEDLTFMKENWSACLGKKQIIECPVEESTSPQKSGSPSKSGSSTFENGQKDASITTKHNGASSSLSHSQSAPTENGTSSSKHDSKDTGASSELTNESQQNGGKDGDDTKAKPHPESQHSSQSLLSEDDEDMEGNDSKLEAAEKNEAGKEPLPDSQSSMSEDPKKLEAAKEAEDNNNQSDYGDSKQPDVDKDEQMVSKEGGEEEEEVGKEDEATEQKSWKVGLYKKFRHFESSAIHMEQAIEPTTVGRQNDESMSNLLTNCAESLSISYLTANEFMDASQQCENEIEKTTSEMEQVLETMFPARGKKKNVVTSDQSENLQQRIEDLMASRRETVAAKLALLMTPKR